MLLRCPPRGIWQVPTCRLVPTPLALAFNLLAAKPAALPLPPIVADVALAAIEADSVAVEGLAAQIATLREAVERPLRGDQLQAIELCALSQRKEKERLERLFIQLRPENGASASVS